MLKAFYTGYLRDDQNAGKWFSDKSVWQRMFRTMSGCGFNSMIFASRHPVDDAEMHHWIFNAALDYEIAPFLLFSSCSGIEHCVRALLEEYTELTGIVVDAGESDAVANAIDAVRPDAALYVRGCRDNIEELVGRIKRRGGRPVKFLVKYTREYLVDPSRDSTFRKWVEAVGAENVAADFQISNFEPWTSFSFETVEGILENLDEMGCDGFSLAPLAPYEWPHTSDTGFKHQWQRDMVWYSVWGGSSLDGLTGSGNPKWLMRNRRLIPGFAAGSRILELLALYFGGDESCRWRPQFCSIFDSKTGASRLLSIEDMLQPPITPILPLGGEGVSWWHEITGDRVVYLDEYLKSGTPPDAYGPEELIEELADLAAQAIEAGEKGMRSASGEKELPSLSRDAFCMGRLGEFYVERLRAALCRGRGDNKEALEHLSRALGLYREIRAVDNSHREPFKIAVGDRAVPCDWLDTIKALEDEYAESAHGCIIS